MTDNQRTVPLRGCYGLFLPFPVFFRSFSTVLLRWYCVSTAALLLFVEPYCTELL